jgi:hypothetical protein
VAEAALSARAVLALVGLRLEKWDRELAGDAEGTTLLAPHNAIDPAVPPDGDVVIDPRKRS